MGFKILSTGVLLSIRLGSLERATMNIKLLPAPRVDRQIMSPSNIFVIFLEIIRPKPIPLELRA